MSAWSDLDPKFKTKDKGWTVSGEFACPWCGCSIGKNLKNESPFKLAEQHLALHTPSLLTGGLL